MWQTLQERIERSLEEKDRMYFKGNCVRRASMFVCVLESHVLFAVSTSSVCLYYKKSDSLYTNMSAS